MKKLFNTILALAFLAALIRFGFNLFLGGHHLTYTLKDDDQLFTINELFSTNHQSNYRYEKDKPNYLLEIALNNDPEPTFVFKLFGGFNFYQRIITDIKYFKTTNLKCIYPVFKMRNFQNDLICLDKNQLTYYSGIKGKYPDLDNFVTSLAKEYDYYHPSWTPFIDEFKVINNIYVYHQNIPPGHTIVLWNYTGIRSFTNIENHTVNLLPKDNYDNQLGILADKYYVTPNYSKTHAFSTFITLDVTSNAKKEINLLKEISIDSYIQGVVAHKIYLFDKTNQLQYEIDPQAKTCVQIGDANSDIKYFNGAWTTINLSEAMNNRLFTIDYTIPAPYKDYSKIDNVLGDDDGYYYLYFQSGNNTKVYRADKRRPEALIFLFEIENPTNIKYKEDYLYLVSNDTVYVYHDKIGLRPVLKNFELLFNKTNMYDVYSK